MLRGEDRGTLGQAGDTAEEICKHQHPKPTVTLCPTSQSSPGGGSIAIYDWTHSHLQHECTEARETRAQAHSRPHEQTAPQRVGPGMSPPGKPDEASKYQLCCLPWHRAGSVPGALQHTSLLLSLVPKAPGDLVLDRLPSNPSRTQGGGRCGLGIQPLTPPCWGAQAERLPWPESCLDLGPGREVLAPPCLDPHKEEQIGPCPQGGQPCRQAPGGPRQSQSMPAGSRCLTEARTLAQDQAGPTLRMGIWDHPPHCWPEGPCGTPGHGGRCRPVPRLWPPESGNTGPKEEGDPGARATLLGVPTRQGF